ncbi:amidohydrolase family protein [Photobacterium rosenbergii]|uniref:amidohydrolase family protein n=1 Tax=Photobacterium rosenbergii TaxID=294936 RepID=UPI001C98F262|nr:amidohydrolase family protein [Photobacterium rosenbergii]MBY5945029.1 amidohydrolase family protein [Photobacterium rosenbergii]
MRKYKKTTIAALLCAPIMVNGAPLLIKDASLIISMESTDKDLTGRLYEKDILVEDGQIKAIGKNLVADNAKVVNASGKIVMPGLIDVHNHLWQSTIRGCGIDKNVKDWLPPCVFPISFNYQQAYDAVTLSTLDLINTGVTTVVDWSHAYNAKFVEGNVQALQDSGMRYVYTYNLNPLNNAHAKVTKAQVDKDTLGTFHLASHPAGYMQDTVQNAVDMAKEMETTLNFHYAENKKDRLDEQTATLINTNATDVRLVLNHVVDVNDEEIDMMAKTGAKVSYNALSNMRLASGVAPVEKMYKAGIDIGMGLDGGTSDNSNYFALMKAAIGLQRAYHQDPSVFPTVEDVLYLSTMGGAKVIGMEEKIGSLAVGKRADLIILNPATTNMGVNHDELAQIAFNAEPVNVEYVVVEGNILKDEGQLPISDKDFHALLERNEKTVQLLKKGNTNS